MWQDAHTGFVRCVSICLRSDAVVPTACFVERGHIRRRRRWRRTEDVLQDVLAANDDRRPRRIAGDGEHAAMAQHAAALVRRELDAPELRSGHALDAVVGRQQLVEERVPRVDELADRTVLAQDPVEEHPRLGLHRVAQLGPPGGELLRVRLDAVEISNLEPLAGKILRHREGLRIGEHPRQLRLEDLRRAQPAPFGQRQQLLVRHRVPQEVTQPRGQLDVRNPVHAARIGRVAVALDVKQEMRRHEHRLDRERDALLHRLPVVPSRARRTSVSAATSAPVTGRRYARRATVARIRSTQRGPDAGLHTRICLRLGFSP